MAIVSVSLPDAMLDEVDRFVERRAYAGRSEVVRAALRDFIQQEDVSRGWKGDRAATMTLVYPKGNERAMAELRHQYQDVVKSMMHSDVGTGCTEVFMLHGAFERIREFADRLRAYRHVQRCQVVYGETEPPEPVVR